MQQYKSTETRYKKTDSRVLIFVNNKKISDMLHGRIDEDFEDQFGVIHL
jgi:hypothetical protein